MTTSDSVGQTILRIPGNWSHPGELLDDFDINSPMHNRFGRLKLVRISDIAESN